MFLPLNSILLNKKVTIISICFATVRLFLHLQQIALRYDVTFTKLVI